MPIPEELVPVAALEMVRDAEKFDVATWRNVVREWPMVTIKVALVARSRSEQQRIEGLRKGENSLDKLATNGVNNEDASRVWVSLLCLSDAALGRLFAALDDEDKLGDIPRATRRKLRSGAHNQN